MGFVDVVEVVQGVMDIVSYEVVELKEKLEEGQLFMIIFCCLFYIELVNKYILGMKFYVFFMGFLMYYVVCIVKECYLDVKIVFIGLCVVKCKEVCCDECVDYIFIFEEMVLIFEGLDI